MILQKGETVDTICKFFTVRVRYEWTVEILDYQIAIAFFIILCIKIDVVISAQYYIRSINGFCPNRKMSYVVFKVTVLCYLFSIEKSIPLNARHLPF